MTTDPTIAVDLRAVVDAPTGIGVYTRSLVTTMADQGHRFVGLAHRAPSDPAWLEELGIPVEVQPAPLGLLWQQLRLPRRLDRGDLDCLWSPLQTLPLRLPVPGVVTVHDLTALTMPETHRFKVRFTQTLLLGRSLARARRIAVDSAATGRDLERLFPGVEDRVRVVHLGVDGDFTPGNPPEIAATRRELGCPEGYLLAIGTLEPRKNLATLLDSWEALRREEPETTPPLVVAGGPGWKSGDILARLRRLEPAGVRYLGRLERKRQVEVVRAASVFAYPSLSEGFGLPPLEAMACGVPTVVSTGGSLPEVVGDGALTVPADDPSRLAEAIRRLLQHRDAARELAARGRRRARSFTWDKTAEEMASLFAEALAR